MCQPLKFWLLICIFKAVEIALNRFICCHYNWSRIGQFYCSYIRNFKGICSCLGVSFLVSMLYRSKPESGDNRGIVPFRNSDIFGDYPIKHIVLFLCI